MNKKILTISVIFLGIFCFLFFYDGETKTTSEETEEPQIETLTSLKKEKKSLEEKRRTIEQRAQFDFNMQKNPATGLIPREEKELELEAAMREKSYSNSRASNTRAFTIPYEARGPSNLGGRTRALAVDLSDVTGNTMLAGGVSSGMFRTTDGGASWVKVSPNDEIHNVTAIAQDPRVGFQNIWYYGTGEVLGNSANLGGALYNGQGIWRSTDSGQTWTQIPGTDSTFEEFDSVFDYNNSLAVSPTTGDLYIATFDGIFSFDGTNLSAELFISNAGNTDVKVTATGRVFVSVNGASGSNGVYTSLAGGNGTYTRIAQNGTPMGWAAAGRIVLGIAPSDTDVVYALYANGNGGAIEADLWRYDAGTDIWTDFSAKLPDEPGGDLAGNDPFAVQGGYDLEVSVKPDDVDFVVIGGVNIFRIADIVNDATFERIGGYINNTSFASYGSGDDAANDGDTHHPDIHDLVFSPFNPNTLLSGTDGGVHTTDVTTGTVRWTSLNNDYQTYQFYHVGLDPQAGSDVVVGGAQDNGTTIGGTSITLPDVANTTEMTEVSGADGGAAAVGRRSTGSTLPDIDIFHAFQNGDLFATGPFRAGAAGGVDVFLSPLDPTATQVFFHVIRPAGTSSSIFVTYFHLDTDSNTLYYADGPTLHRANNPQTVLSNNGGWSNIGSLSTSQNIRSIASTRGAYTTSSFTLIGGENGGVFKHVNPRNTNLNTAVNITPSGASTIANSVVSGVAIHPTDPDIGMVVYSNYGINNIYITSNLTDASPTWTLAERNLSAHSIRSAAITETDGVITYFVGTARGLYSSTNPITIDWTLESPNQIALSIVNSLVYRPDDGVMLIGTHGNGMYQVNLDSCPTTTTYTTAGGWDNGVPTEAVRAIIADDYDTSAMGLGDITACTLTINAGATLTVEDGNFVSVLNDITVNGTLDISNEGSLVQVNEAAETFNNGTISVEKITPTIDDRNYVAMSSPVTAEARDRVYGNSRAVFSIIPSNFVPFDIDLMAFPEFAGAENFLDDDNDYLLPVIGSTDLPAAGIGQLVFPQPEANVGDGSYTLTYTQNAMNPGTLNSGTITVPINYNGPETVNNYNLLGNPYASAIDVTAFINANDAVDAVYYWDHITSPDSTLPGPGTSNFSMNDISIRNAMMGTAAVNMGGPPPPGQFMSSTQGFGIKALQAEAASSTPVVFTNSMRVTGNNDGFRTNESVSNTDKLWLNLTTTAYDNATSQIGIGFTENATAGYDAGYDTQRLGTFLSLFTNLEGEYLAIQGREVFDTQIELSVGFSTTVETSETYTISIDHLEGTGLENAPIYIIDNELNTITNLKDTPYTFTATKGIQPDRFIVVFEEREILSTEEAVIENNEVSIFPNPASSEITLGYTGNQQLETATIINVNGQIVKELDLSNFSQSQQISVNDLSKGIYFIQVISEDQTIVKKLIIR
ncbi:T9SS type A sorting domain-containing protein [uncultured Dokdonia sp.]|uniref:T9SS type A sorting domain-containing protein n=1 Tax=uncultured Dokdonia sp. TaxID=575653 RepID=UPI00262B1F70|nr:T9SS type A sorting domain-containing protein [uncultured Dokdonia sp.]